MLGLFGLVSFPDALLLLRLHDIGFSVPGVILAYVGYNVVYAALSYPSGALADRPSPARVFGIGLLVFAVVYAGLGLTESHALAWALIAGYGAYTDGQLPLVVSGVVAAGVAVVVLVCFRSPARERATASR